MSAGSAAALLYTAPNYPLLLTGRVTYGLGIGFAMHAAPAYIAETAAASVRGLLIRQACSISKTLKPRYSFKISCPRLHMTCELYMQIEEKRFGQLNVAACCQLLLDFYPAVRTYTFDATTLSISLRISLVQLFPHCIML